MDYILLILALIGLADAIYLTYESFKPEVLVCPLNFDCDAVLKSKYSKFMGIKNEYLGLAFYLGITTLVLGLFFTPQYTQVISNLLLLGTGVGFLYSLYLFYLQAVILKNYCLYCLVSSATSTLLFIVSLLAFL